jgi:CheY-like chemotaxis protein
MKNIVIIDDNKAIRLVISSALKLFFQNQTHSIFTASEGVEGLGFVFVTNPDLVIVDLTLPKYSGREIVDFLITNESIKEKHIPVIVLTENEKEIELPQNFITINKSKKNFVRELKLAMSLLLKTEFTEEKSFLTTIFEKTVNRIITLGNSIDVLSENKNRVERIINFPLYIFDTILLSFYIAAYLILFKEHHKDGNIELKKKDQERFRVQAYPAIAFTIASVLLICFQIGIFLSAVEITRTRIAAASYTWDGGGDDITCGGNAGDGNKWSCALNWSSDIVPTSSDSVTFNGTSTKDAVVDAGFGGVVTSVNIAAGYTGTITLQRSLQTTSTFTQSAGTFNASNQTIDINSAYTLSSGIFRASSGSSHFGSHFTISGGTFDVATNPGGTIRFDDVDNGTLSCNNTTFNLVVFDNISSKTVGSDCNMPLGNNPTITNTGNINVNGTLSGTGTLTRANAGNLTINAGGALSGFSGLNLITFTVAGANLNLSSYTSFSTSSTLTLSSGSLSLPSGADLNAALTISGGTFTAPSGSMTVAGALTITGAPVFNANGGTVIFDGTLVATLSCNNVIFNLVTFNNSAAKVVNTDCNLPIGANPTLAGSASIILNGTLSGSGTLTKTGGTLTLNNVASTLSGFTGLNVFGFSHIAPNSNFTSYSPFVVNDTFTMAGGTLTLPSIVDSNNNLTISAGTFNAPSGNFSLAGALSISGSPVFNANGGTFTFDGFSSVALSCNNVVFNLVNITHTAGVKTINSNCTFPLGNNPSIAQSIHLSGVLSGTGTLSMGGGSTLTYNGTSASLIGFSGLTSGSIVVQNNAVFNIGSYTTFTNTSSFTQSSGTVTLPNGADLNGLLIISGGTFNAPSGSMTQAGSMTISGSPTFNANGGTIIFDGSGGTLTCNSVIFNLVVLNHVASTSKTVNNGCNLPLGNNPTISGGVFLHGTLLGTGTMTLAGSASTVLNPTASFSGFSGITTTIGAFTVAGATADFSSYTSFVAGNSVSLTSGTFSLPNGANLNGNGGFTISGGTFNAPNGTMSLEGSLTISGAPVFNANGGTFNFDGTSQGTLTCNGVVFNLVTFTHTAPTLKIINSNCNLPLGSNPTITGSVRLNAPTATLSGTGVLTSTAEVASSIDMVTGQLAGFSGLEVLGSMIVNGANVDLSSYSSAVFYGRNADNGLRISSGTFTAPTGTMTLYDRLRRSGGTFNHSNGTVRFLCEPGDLTVGPHDFSFTFYNLIVQPTIACSFVSSDGETTTVLNNLTLRGADDANKLSIISGVPGSQCSLDASNATLDLDNLTVTDSNSLNRIINTEGLNVTNGGNNTNWNFGNPIVSNLGPTNYVNGSLVTDNTPALTFNVTDPQSSDQIKYQIQIDNNPDFSSLELDYTSDFLNQGDISFTPPTAIPDGNYYWRVKGLDALDGVSSFISANGGSLAFSLDTIAPTGNIVIGDSTSSDPKTVRLLTPAFDTGSGVSEMIISESYGFFGASWESYKSSKDYTFQNGGSKIIYVKYRDRAGLESYIYAASVVIVLPNPEDNSTDVPILPPDLSVTEELYTVIVKVVNQFNEPISGVNATLASLSKGGITLSDGTVKFEGVAPGEYTLIIEYEGEKIEQKVQLVGTGSEIVVKVIIEQPVDLSMFTVIGLIVIGGIIFFTAILTGPHLFGVVFGFIFLTKKKYWGIVHDMNNHSPIAFASVKIYDENNKFIKENVSDLKGRYGIFLEKPGNYTLKCQQTGYSEFTKKLNIQNIADEIAIDIPMEDKGTDVHHIKRDLPMILNIMAIILTTLMIIGLLFSAYAAYVQPLWFNFVIIGTYSLLLITNVLFLFRVYLENKLRGKVVDKENRGVGGAALRFYNDKGQVGVVLTNANGEIKMNIKPDEYKVSVNKEGFIASESLVEVEINQKGYMNDSLRLNKIGESSNNLNTPF